MALVSRVLRLAAFRALVEENVKMSVQRIGASEIIRKVYSRSTLQIVFSYL